MSGQLRGAVWFTASTAAPGLSTASTVLGVLSFLGRHCLAVALLASVAVLLLVVRGFAEDARQHRAIRSGYRQWKATGQPVAGWGPGWAWSPRPAAAADPVEEVEEVAAAEDGPTATEVEVCQSCRQQPASVTIAYAGGPTFAVCSACSPAATVVGRAS